MSSLAYREFKAKHAFPWLLILEVKILNPNSAGFPSDAGEIAAVRLYSDALIERLSKDISVHSVARMTIKGWRVNFCYLATPQPAAFLLETIAASEADREFAFEIVEDRLWEKPSKTFGIPDFGIFSAP